MNSSTAERFDLRELVLTNRAHHHFHRDFVCGLGAAFIETLVTFPLNKLIFRQQLHNIYARKAAGQLFSEGFRYLYRGLLPPLCQKTASRAIMFGMYDHFSSLLSCNEDKSFTFCHSFAAMFAGWTEALLTPFERVQTLMQSERYHGQFRNTFHVFSHVRTNFGVREYYRGFTVILVRNGAANALFFGCRESLHDFLMLSRRSNEVIELTSHFFAGALLGASISTITFPLNVIKTRLQSNLGGTFESPYQAFKQLLHERSFKQLFRGVHLNFTRSMLTWGITNSVYELFKWVLFETKD